MKVTGSLFTDDGYGNLVPSVAPAPSRSTDPPSSKSAANKVARSGSLAGCAAVVLDILKRLKTPRTYREIWANATEEERLKLKEPVMVMRRLDGLRKAGLVRQGKARPCAVSGNDACEWEIVDS
jgi:hypothetical protein